MLSLNPSRQGIPQILRLSIGHPILKLLLVSVACLTAWPAEAQIYKCNAKYKSGLVISIDLVIPINTVWGYISFTPMEGKAKPIIGQSMLDTGLVAHKIAGANTAFTEATLIITNRNPFITATFIQGYHAINIRVDGKPPNARITYYDPSFIPDELAFGTCM